MLPVSNSGLSCKTGRGLTYLIADSLNGHLIANGTDGVVLSCKIVNKSDGTFELSGSISGTATAKSDAISYAGSAGTSDPLEVPITFTFASHGISASEESDLTITYVSSDLGALEVPDTAAPCTLMASAKYDGFLLADFECPLVVSPGDATSGCQISGALHFLYCDMSE